MKKLCFHFCLLFLFAFISCDRLEKKALGHCEDGIQNQNELDVDCGGVCDPCPNCSDKKKNQDETAIDCGGVCLACASCTDGIQNQDEEGVDCGGSCGVCPNCEDGIKNQSETGIDCGGPCQPCAAASCTTQLGFAENGYLSISPAAFVGTSFEINTEAQAEITLALQLFSYCKQYKVTIYESTFLIMPIGQTQLFTVDYENSNKINKCFMEVYLQTATVSANPGQTISITRVDATTFNVRFCNLEVSNLPTNNFNTKFSANANFTIN